MPRSLITDAEARRRCGDISHTTIWRWDQKPEVGFPPPVYIAGRKYRDAAEVDAWLERQVAAGPAEQDRRRWRPAQGQADCGREHT